MAQLNTGVWRRALSKAVFLAKRAGLSLWSESSASCSLRFPVRDFLLVGAFRTFHMGKFWRVFIGMFDSAGHFDHCADD